MKTKKIITGSVLGIAFATSVFIGCKKDSPITPTTNTDITSAMDEANASYAATDSKNIADAAIQWQSSGYTPNSQSVRKFSDIYGSCAKVHGNDTLVGGANDTVVYIEFGESDCSCRDGRERRGTIIVYWGLQHPGETLLKAYFDSANTITETFRNYYLRGNGIAGTRTWTNEGHNVNGYSNWALTANLTITYPEGQTTTWNSTRNNILIQDNGIWYYEISGNAKGTSRNGVEYTLTITSPLYITALPWWAGGCPWPEAGVVTIIRAMPAGGVTVTLTVTYGTLGTCSGNKTVTVNGKTSSLAMW